MTDTHPANSRYNVFNILCSTVLLLAVSGCGQFMASAKKDFAEDLSATILQHDDQETIRQAVPAYLVLVSSMIRGDPDNIGLLVSGSRLYSAYATAFVEQAERKKNLAQTAYKYAERAICLQANQLCQSQKMSYFEFEIKLKELDKADLAPLFAWGSAWAGSIQANSGDWNAVADLPRVKAIIQRVIELDPDYSNGDPWLYLAVMQSFLPAAMGGNPEEAKQNFEKAIAVSDRNNLMALLLYAEKYARLVFDRELHDRLLKEVIEKDISDSEARLIDKIAKIKAQELLSNADDYF